MSGPSEIYPDRLLQLSEEVSRIAGSLAQLSLGAGLTPRSPASESTASDPLVSHETVTWLIRARRERARYLKSDLFCDPAWDILLDLLRAELAQQRVAVSSLCIAACVPATTALRYLKTMVERGMIIRRADQHDGRRVFVELSPEMSKALREYFVNVIRAHGQGAETRQAAA